MKSVRYVAIICVISIGATPLYATIEVHTSDFITNTSRTNFNSFEALPPVLDHGLPGLHIEDGIRVEQIATTSHGIVSLWWWSGNVGNPQPPDGARSWYPNVGDNGYARITRVDGLEFHNVGFMRGSGIPEVGNQGAGTMLYELYQGGSLVLAGSVPHVQNGLYLGFSGGGFNEIRVRDGAPGDMQSFYDGTRNGLALDAIELSVPEPSSMALVALAVLGVTAGAFNRVRV
jgi:hypothetical protein